MPLRKKQTKEKSGKRPGMIGRGPIGTALGAVGLTPREGALAYAGAQIAAPLLGPLFGAVYPMMIAAMTAIPPLLELS